MVMLALLLEHHLLLALLLLVLLLLQVEMYLSVGIAYSPVSLLIH
jgi:hypothetical protein